MTEKVSFASNLGEWAAGELALPSGSAEAPGVVLLHEWWGINAHVRALLDRLAAAGFAALAPDLFHGNVAPNAGEAARLMRSLDWARALDEIAGAARHLAGHSRCTGKVGAVGFCMGGALAFAAATRVPELAAVVPFYGVPERAQADYSKVRAPILAHFASRDDWAKPEAARAIQREIEACGGSMTLHLYEADHAFVNDTRPEVHSPEAARVAWERTIEFFHQHLG